MSEGAAKRRKVIAEFERFYAKGEYERWEPVDLSRFDTIPPAAVVELESIPTIGEAA